MVHLDYVVWIVTTRCNLQCRHCYAKLYLGEQELTRGEKLLLARQLCEAGVPHINLTGGEPLLLGEELLEIVKLARDYGVEVSVVTNGTVRNEELVRQLVRHDVYFYVSVDGGKTGHESLRGVGTWERVHSFLKLLSEQTRNFGTVMALSKLNYRDIVQYIEDVLKYEPESISVIPVMPSGVARQTGSYITVQELKEAIRLLEEAVRRYDIQVWVWCLPCARAYTRDPRIISYSCKLRRVVDISPSGRLLLCDVTNIEVCRWTPQKHVEELIEEYFESEIVRNVLTYVPSECRDCPLVEICRGGCYARSALLYGDLSRRDPLCPR